MLAMKKSEDHDPASFTLDPASFILAVSILGAVSGVIAGYELDREVDDRRLLALIAAYFAVAVVSIFRSYLGRLSPRAIVWAVCEENFSLSLAQYLPLHHHRRTRWTRPLRALSGFIRGSRWFCVRGAGSYQQGDSYGSLLSRTPENRCRILTMLDA